MGVEAMRRSTAFRIAGLIVLAVIALLIFPLTNEAIRQAADSLVFWAGTSSTSLILLLVVAVLCVPGFLALRWLWARYELWGSKKVLGMGDKMFSVDQMREAAFEEIRALGVEDASMDSQGKQLHVAAQRINSPSSDTPYAFFLITTEPVRGANKNEWKNIADSKKWVIFVDRRTNERSWNPDINDWAGADALLAGMREQALPIEKKKSLEKMLEENIMRGFGGAVGEKAASREDAGKEKHQDKGSEKK